MPKLRVHSAEALVKIFISFGFAAGSQRGSDIKLGSVIDSVRQVLIVPNHRELDKGTLRAIYRQASRCIDESVLRPQFYID